jgi:hypothetical protein
MFVFKLLLLTSCDDIISSGTFTEISRIYSQDSSKFILQYDYAQGAWDGGRTFFVTILNATDTVNPSTIKYSYSNFDFDDIYWKGNDTIIIEEKFTEYINQGKSNLKDTTLNEVAIKIILKDPIDTSFTRKVFYHETSPKDNYELIVYRYVKPVNGDYFLNISVINKGDHIPKFGNFYISLYNFDCITDIKWEDSKDILDIKVSESCFHAFIDYLVENRPKIEYNVQIDDTIKGNI